MECSSRIFFILYAAFVALKSSQSIIICFCYLPWASKKLESEFKIIACAFLWCNSLRNLRTLTQFSAHVQ